MKMPFIPVRPISHHGFRFIKHAVLVFLLAALTVCGASAETAGIIIENGQAQPMARYTDPRSLNYMTRIWTGSPI